MTSFGATAVKGKMFGGDFDYVYCYADAAIVQQINAHQVICWMIYSIANY